MADKLPREELVNEMTALNEEADYHAERCKKLEDQRDALLELVKGWWGVRYQTAYCIDLQERSEKLMADIAKANV